MDPDVIRQLVRAGTNPASIDSVYTALGFQPYDLSIRRMPSGTLGAYDHIGRGITLNREYLGRALPRAAASDWADVLLHEMTHEAQASRGGAQRVGPDALHDLLDTLKATFAVAPREAQLRHVEDYYGPSDTTGAVVDRIGWAGYNAPALREVTARTMQRAFDLARNQRDPTQAERDFPGTLDALRFLTARFPAEGAEGGPRALDDAVPHVPGSVRYQSHDY